MRQAAQAIVQCDPHQTVVEDLVNYIADQHGFPSKQETIARAPEGLGESDWRQFLEVHRGYQPILVLETRLCANSETPESRGLLTGVTVLTVERLCLFGLPSMLCNKGSPGALGLVHIETAFAL